MLTSGKRVLFAFSCQTSVFSQCWAIILSIYKTSNMNSLVLNVYSNNYDHCFLVDTRLKWLNMCSSSWTIYSTAPPHPTNPLYRVWYQGCVTTVASDYVVVSASVAVCTVCTMYSQCTGCTQLTFFWISYLSRHISF